MGIDSRYRPQRWADVAGNEPAVKLCRYLAESVRDTGDPEVVLLTGPSGVGKTTLGLIMARVVGARHEYQIDRLGGDNGRMDAAGLSPIVARWRLTSLFGVRVLFLDEVDSATKGAQQILKGFLEHLPRHSLVVMTSNIDPGDGELFTPLYRGPLLRRAHPIHLTKLSLATRKGKPGPGALRVKAVMAAEGLDGRPDSYYIRMINESGGNIGAAITRAFREAVLSQ